MGAAPRLGVDPDTASASSATKRRAEVEAGGAPHLVAYFGVREEALEHLLAELRGESAAGVAHGQGASRRPAPPPSGSLAVSLFEGDKRALLTVNRPPADIESRALAARLQEHVLQALGAIGEHVARGGIEHKLHVHVRADDALEHLAELHHHRAHVEPLHSRRLSPRKREHLPREAGGALGRRADVARHLEGAAVRPQLLLQLARLQAGDRG